MKKFTILDNGRFADTRGYPNLSGKWKNATFDSLEQAIKYAHTWLEMLKAIPDGWEGEVITYSGDGDTLEIVFEEDNNCPAVLEKCRLVSSSGGKLTAASFGGYCPTHWSFRMCDIIPLCKTSYAGRVYNTHYYNSNVDRSRCPY